MSNSPSDPELSPPEEEAAGRPALRSSGGLPARILVADPAPHTRVSYARLLRDHYDVTTTSDGQSALDSALDYAPDLVLADVTLPGIDAFSLLRALRQNPRTSTALILLLSDDASEQARVEGLEAGADDYLERPFSDRELLARISSHLAISRLRREAAERERRLRKLAERERERWRDILCHAPALIVVLSGPNHVFEMVNDAYVLATGRKTATEFVGKSVRDALPELEGQRVVETLDHVYRTAQPFFGNEVPLLLDRSGTGKLEKVYFNFVYQPERDIDGHVQGILAHAVEVTEQVEARHRVEASEKRLSAIFSQANVGISQADINGRFALANQRFCEIVGRSPEELYTLSVADITHPDDLPANMKLFGELIASGVPYSLEKRYVRPDGSIVWALVTSSLVRDEAGAPQYSLGVVQDITARRNAEAELRRVNEDLRQFAFAASHDLQEPLRMVTSYSQLLLKNYAGNFDENAATFVRFIREGVGRMRDLLHDLLAYTAITGVDEVPETVDLNRVLQNVEFVLQPIIAGSGAVIEAGPLPLLTAQEPHVAQLFQNLIANAIKYRSPDVAPHIQISAELSGAFWLFSFRDNGIGIEPRYHEKIFGVFKRLHGRDIPGTGIGLAICQRVVGRYGGRIWVESELGRGSTFFFTWPAVLTHEEPPPARLRSANTTPDSAPGS